MKPVFHVALSVVDHLEQALDTPLHVVRSAVLIVALAFMLLEASGSVRVGQAEAPTRHPATGAYPWTCDVPASVPQDGASEYCTWVKEQAADKQRATESIAAPAQLGTTATGRQLAAATSTSRHRHAGTVSAISTGSLTISQKSGKSYTFVLAADTAYLHRGSPIARASIGAGDYVSVTYSTSAGQLVAWHVSKR